MRSFSFLLPIIQHLLPFPPHFGVQTTEQWKGLICFSFSPFSFLLFFRRGNVVPSSGKIDQAKCQSTILLQHLYWESRPQNGEGLCSNVPQKHIVGEFIAPKSLFTNHLSKWLGSSDQYNLTAT